MRVAVVHNAVTDDSPADEQDVLIQAAAVRGALQELGHEVWMQPCSLELGDSRCRLEALRPDLVFNLVESLDGQGRLIHLFPAMLDAMALPYTGARTEAMWFTSHKVLAKERMLAAGLPTPAWMGPYPQGLPSLVSGPHSMRLKRSKQRWIIKSLWEHASVGLEASSVVEAATDQSVQQAMEARAPFLGGACFAEVFVDGREFNLSVLAGHEGPQVLPPAEIIFEGYDVAQPRIVDYRAKWDVASREYHHTPRSFDFKHDDRPLLNRLEALALKCWQLFGLRGYARVDFRVDETGRPWILEINANPCLSPDAGFAAAVDRAGMTFTEAVERILADGMDQHRRHRVRRTRGGIKKLQYAAYSSDL